MKINGVCLIILGSIAYNSFTFEDTIFSGRRLGRSLKGGEVVLLIGELGCGKTSFTKGIALGLGIDDIVTSPSFTIMNEYQGKLKLFHFDFYRIDEVTEMEDLLSDYLYREDGVLAIEWGKGILMRLSKFIVVRFQSHNTHRVITIERKGF